MKLLITALQKIILADFKTTKKKFIDQGIEEDVVDTYFADFKFLKDRNKIKSLEDKNIDNWGKKSWDEFVEFIDDLKKEKSKSEEIRELKSQGAELVAEDDNWRVYKITTYEASRIYGSGAWCITRDEKWWKKYTRRSQFYFMLSKNRPENDTWYKIALQLGKNGRKTYWDNTDKSHKNLPSNLHMVKYETLFEDTSADLPIVEQIIGDLDAFAEDEYEYLIDPDQNESMVDYLYEQELEFQYIDDDLKERLVVLEKLAEKLDKDYETLLKDACHVEFSNSYRVSHNQLAYIGLSGDDREIPEDLKEAYDSLTDEEKEEVKRGVDHYFNGDYVSVGSDQDHFVLILDEEKVEDTIKELSENLKVQKHSNTPKIDLLALKGKNVSTRKMALEKTENQDTIEKAYLDDSAVIRELATSKIKNPKMLADIAKNDKEDNKVRIAAINNENFLDEKYLKNIVETYDLEESADWSLYTAAFDNIKDFKWLSKYVMRPGINGSKRDDFVEMLAKKMEGKKKTPTYISYLKQLAGLMVREDQAYILTNIAKEIPDTEQNFLKKIASLPSENGYRSVDPRAIAVVKIKDEKFLKSLITKNIKGENQSRNKELISASFSGIHDQVFLTKCLSDKKYGDYTKYIAKNIEDEKVLTNWLENTHGSDIEYVLGHIKSEKAKIRLLVSTKIWDFKKVGLINTCDAKILEKAFLLMKNKDIKSDEIPGTLQLFKKRLIALGKENSLLFKSINKYLVKELKVED